MPGIFYIGWGILAFLSGHLLEPTPKVVIVQDGEIVAERTVHSPILIVKDGENFQIRTAKATDESDREEQELVRRMTEEMPH